MKNLEATADGQKILKSARTIPVVYKTRNQNGHSRSDPGRRNDTERLGRKQNHLQEELRNEENDRIDQTEHRTHMKRKTKSKCRTRYINPAKNQRRTKTEDGQFQHKTEKRYQ